MEDIKKGQIRSLVGGVYDIQKLRIATGNRIVASMRPDLVKSLSDAEGVEEVHVLKDILAEYRNITDYFVNTCNSKGSIEKAINSVTPTPDYVKTKVEYALVQSYERLVDAEAGLNRAVTVYVKQHPMWGLFFEGVKGCGPMMAAVCIAYLDPYQARHCSSFWKYCGLDVVTNDKGEQVGRQKYHTVMVEYTDKATRSITYNPFVKTKLLGVLAGSFLKAGADTKYAKIYYDYKNRITQRDADISPIVAHRRASRYAVKMFLRDLWVAWRTYEGLEVSEPYEVAKLGMKPHHDPMLAPEWYRAIVNDYRDEYHEKWALNVEETRRIARIPEERETHFIMHNIDDVLLRMHTFATNKK